MIDLYTWSTANGRKISILLEEMNIPYKVFDVDITNDEQFTKKFSLISASNKIPAIVDNENGKSIFESGAIMLYLATKHNQFIPEKYYWEIMKWFFFQISQVGPFLGQAHQYLFYHSRKSPFAEKKSKNYVKRIYETLDNRLSESIYLGHEYSIADIATWPWIARYEIHDVDIKNYTNILRWYQLIAKRPKVIKGYNVSGKYENIPQP